MHWALLKAQKKYIFANSQVDVDVKKCLKEVQLPVPNYCEEICNTRNIYMEKGLDNIYVYL